MAAVTVVEAAVCTAAEVDSMGVAAASPVADIAAAIAVDTAVAITADIQEAATTATVPMRARTVLTLVPMDLMQVPEALILVCMADTVAPAPLRRDAHGHGKATRLGTFPPDGISLILAAPETPHAPPHHHGHPYPQHRVVRQSPR